jgi:hypothetical protein
MGLVIMVEHAPPVNDAYIFARNQLSMHRYLAGLSVHEIPYPPVLDLKNACPLL